MMFRFLVLIILLLSSTVSADPNPEDCINNPQGCDYSKQSGFSFSYDLDKGKFEGKPIFDKNKNNDQYDRLKNTPMQEADPTVIDKGLTPVPYLDDELLRRYGLQPESN